jgi:hypothetical protein
VSGQSRRLSISHHCFVHVTPTPIFPRLKRLDYRVPAAVKVLPCMPMRRGVAAADVTAGQAHPQMHS